MINKRNILIALIVLSCSFAYSHFILAEDSAVSVDISSGTTATLGDVGATLDVDAGANVSTALSTDESILPAPRTSPFLRSVLDKVTLSAGGSATTDSATACVAINSAYESLSGDESGSLAWTGQSYASARDDFGALKGAQVTFFANVKAQAKITNDAFDAFSAKIDNADSVATISRAGAIGRSALVDYLVEAKKTGGPSVAHLGDLSRLVDTSILCLKGVVGSDDVTLKNITAAEEASANLKQSLSSMGASFGATATVEPLSITVNQTTAASGSEEKLSDASKVKVSADLENFANTLAKNDPYITAISVTDTTATVKYKTDAKFLGIFSSHVQAKATLASSGDLSVRYPWYGFLFSKEIKLSSDTVKTEILGELGVKADAGTDAQTAALSAQSSLSARAKLVGALSQSLSKLTEAGENEVDGGVDDTAEGEVTTD